MLSGVLPDTDHLPSTTTELLSRNGIQNYDANDDGDTEDQFDHDGDEDTPEVNEVDYWHAQAIVDAIANEIFDPPTMYMGTTSPPNSGTFSNADGPITILDDEEFDWPYNDENKPANVGDWWETTDCRVMRIAVGEDNQYLNAAVPAVVDDTGTADVDESMDAIPPETSIYCGHFARFGVGSDGRPGN